MKQKVRGLNLPDKKDARPGKNSDIAKEDMFPLRLQVYLARCGVASRRGSEALLLREE